MYIRDERVNFPLCDLLQRLSKLGFISSQCQQTSLPCSYQSHLLSFDYETCEIKNEGQSHTLLSSKTNDFLHLNQPPINPPLPFSNWPLKSVNFLPPY